MKKLSGPVCPDFISFLFQWEGWWGLREHKRENGRPFFQTVKQVMLEYGTKRTEESMKYYFEPHCSKKVAKLAMLFKLFLRNSLSSQSLLIGGDAMMRCRSCGIGGNG